MFDTNTTTKTVVGFATRKPAHCFGYWLEQSTSGLNSIEQDPMQLASFYRGSGN